MKGMFAMLAIVWRLTIPYFKSEDRFAGRMLLAAVIAAELSLVAIDVLFNQWNNRFYNALQDRNWDNFVYELTYFSVLAAIFIGLAVYQLYLNQWLQIRWRTWLTRTYLDRWLANSNHYRMQLLGDPADNPDQRIAEDVRLFIELTMSIGVGLLSAVVTLGSFVVILWALSAEAPLYLFGNEVSIPGYLVWAALVYALVGTVLTHWIGWPLVQLNFDKQRYEADFRFSLVRVRENAEQIALLNGEPAEDARLVDKFGKVAANWYDIMTRTKRLTFLTAGYSQIAIIFPYIVASPAYFASRFQLGGLMQTASAFGSVQRSLSFFVTAYRQLAEWRSVIDRLDGFDRAIVDARLAVTQPPVISVVPDSKTGEVAIDDLVARLPAAGRTLVTADDMVIAPRDRILLTGPSGSGKSTLFRAVAGAWPFGSGTVTIPQGAKLMALPQRPYFPIARLASAVTYPAAPGTYTTARIADVIAAAGLPKMAARLEEEAHWNRMLSLGEQQRLGIARAILHAPDFLFLDEATASLDEPAEALVYRLLRERLPDTTIISIGHRSTLAAFHDRRWALVQDGDLFRLSETAVKAD